VSKLKAKIHYLYHSGFSVETPNYFLVFDYYNDTPDGSERNLLSGVISPDDIKNKNNVFVFSSHSHEDHFNPVIFKWEEYNPNINYILSSDIKLDKMKNNYFNMIPYEVLKLGGSSISTFGSTDIGVSFLVQVDDITIFHSGDLNWWHWKEDSEKEKKQAEEMFKAEIENISLNKIDIAFFPVDPRLEEFCSIGAEYFIEEVQPKMLIPMHFANNPEISGWFAEKMKNSQTRIAQISHRGQEIIY
jgi:L-ascorbate metabolism protein UlaG (beta-lactamase superfamily)